MRVLATASGITQGLYCRGLRPFSSSNSQERQEFKATCLVDEEEMEKLLRERGHMLENHVERLWAYLTIQELLGKRWGPAAVGGGPRSPLLLAGREWRL